MDGLKCFVPGQSGTSSGTGTSSFGLGLALGGLGRLRGERELVLDPLLGADARVIALVTLFTAIHGLFQHCNVDIRLGPLNWFFSMAELHRWHHSKRIEEANTNYGANLILWDVVFGTRFLPADREPPTEIGIEALPDFPPGYWAHLTAPIRWKEIEQSAAPCYGSGDDALRPSGD